MKVVDFTNHNSCAKLASSIVAVNSRLWLYRFLHSNSFFQDVLQLFNRLLTIESIPVVEQVYQAILADVTSNLNILLNFLEQKTIAIGSGSVSTSDLTEDDAEAQHLFLMMYVLTRPLFEFLAKHLQLTNSKLARQYPSVHYGVVKTLYSHCAALLQSNETSIHDSYYAILCCLPVNILTSKLSTHGTLLSSKNDYSDFASIAKQNHMNSPYVETFTTHCLNLILGNNESSKDEHLSEGQYRLLSYEQLQNVGNNTLIWFWAIWECAQFCVMNNLKTSLGKPQETFLALEEQTNHSSTSSSSGEVNVSTDKDDWWCDLHRCRLLLQLIEALEKRQAEVKIFLIKYSIFRSVLLQNASEFEFVIILFVQSFIKLHNSMAIHEIYVWLKNVHQLNWSWIQVCENQAAGNFEQAAYEYKFLLNEHFKSLSMINEKRTKIKYQMQMTFLQDDNEDLLTVMETSIDINAIRGMSCFANRDFEALKISMRKMLN
ncbi:unnamed protein product [Rotaria magnacalcarata]|uniref:Uncharacterized protein n=1 Tax=Rotaria magnacalcarata TaxID=392030 RepID=A0A8S2MH76_9BILA|nr:unnamed protein product [Rotaria magnacalcarata]